MVLVEVSLLGLMGDNATSREWYDLLSKEGVREAKSRGEIEIELKFEKPEEKGAKLDTPHGGLGDLGATVVNIKSNDLDLDEPDVPPWLRGYQALGQWQDRIHGKQD